MSDFDFHCAYGDEGINDGCCVSTSKPNIPYIPHSKYLALKSDLALAVEVLQKIAQICIPEVCVDKIEMERSIVLVSLLAKEALGKIGGGK